MAGVALFEYAAPSSINKKPKALSSWNELHRLTELFLDDEEALCEHNVKAILNSFEFFSVFKLESLVTEEAVAKLSKSCANYFDVLCKSVEESEIIDFNSLVFWGNMINFMEKNCSKEVPTNDSFSATSSNINRSVYIASNNIKSTDQRVVHVNEVESLYVADSVNDSSLPGPLITLGISIPQSNNAPEYPSPLLPSSLVAPALSAYVGTEYFLSAEFYASKAKLLTYLDLHPLVPSHTSKFLKLYNNSTNISSSTESEKELYEVMKDLSTKTASLFSRTYTVKAFSGILNYYNEDYENHFKCNKEVVDYMFKIGTMEARAFFALIVNNKKVSDVYQCEFENILLTAIGTAVKNSKHYTSKTSTSSKNINKGNLFKPSYQLLSSLNAAERLKSAMTSSGDPNPSALNVDFAARNMTKSVKDGATGPDLVSRMQMKAIKKAVAPRNESKKARTDRLQKENIALQELLKAVNPKDLVQVEVMLPSAVTTVIPIPENLAVSENAKKKPLEREIISSDDEEDQEIWKCHECDKVWTVSDPPKSWITCSGSSCDVRMHITCATTDKKGREPGRNSKWKCIGCSKIEADDEAKKDATARALLKRKQPSGI